MKYHCLIGKPHISTHWLEGRTSTSSAAQDRKIKNFPIRNILLVFALFASACSSNLQFHNNTLISRLSNRGPLALSSDNPYLAANLLLAKEMARSADLKGFVETKGSPSALEVQHDFFSPLFFTFYFMKNRQQYTLEDIGGASWLINGPFPIAPDMIKSLSDLTNGQTNVASLLPTLDQAKDESILSKPTAITPPPVEDKIVSTSQNKPSSFTSPAPTNEPATVQSLLEKYNKLNNLSLAEMSPKGDLVHYVTLSNERIEAVCLWYTLENDNSDRIRRINNLSANAALGPGDTIIIPGYLVKNKYRFTESVLNDLVKIIP